MSEIQSKKSREVGYVIVSMSNLFHIFDKERTRELEPAEIKKEDSKKLKQQQSELIEDEVSEHRLIDSKPDNSSKLNQTKDFKLLQEIKSVQHKDIKPRKHKGTCCDYFFNLVLFIFFLLIFNQAFVWVLYFMISQQKNNFYCFDPFLKEFTICSKTTFCPSTGYSRFIFTNDISESKVEDEIENINKKYLDFFIKDSSLFSLLNNKYSKSKEITSYYSVVIVTTKRENFLFTNTFRVTCETVILDFLITLIIAMGFGNFIFGYMADMFGRKKIIIVALSFEVLGGMLIFGETFWILQQGKTHGNNTYVKEYQMFDFNFKQYGKISKFVEDSNKKEYEYSRLNANYEEKFNEIQGEILKNTFINRNFKKYKLFIFAGLFFIFFGNSSIYTISLAYLMENALTEDSMNLNYLFFHFSYPFGILIGGALCTLTDSFHIPLLTLSCLQFVMILIFSFGFYESQRFNFEYSFYREITEFTGYILGWENLKNNYREKGFGEYEKTTNFNRDEQANLFTIYFSENSPKIATELKFKAENEKASFFNSFIENRIRDNFGALTVQKQKKLQGKKENIIKREMILLHPFTLNQLMNKEKQIKNHILIIFSFISSISIVMNLTLTKVTSKVFLPRHVLLSRTIFQTWIFGYFILFYVILYPFIYFIVKFLGISVILFPSLILILIFSGLYELIGMLPREQKNLNTYIFGSFEISFRDHENFLITCNVFVLICAVGLMYSVYFYLTKLTRTIYRCSFFGTCQIFMDATVVISIGLDYFIEKTYFYACLFAIIGIINSYFITSNEDSLNITEMREIIFDDVKNSKRN